MKNSFPYPLSLGNTANKQKDSLTYKKDLHYKQNSNLKTIKTYHKTLSLSFVEP